MISCPACTSIKIVKNGFNATGKQNHLCRECGRQFVLDPLVSEISEQTKSLIDRLLLERISLAGIARAVNVSESWLQSYVNQKYQGVPRQWHVPKLSNFRLVVECGELWSVVLKKTEKQWVWIAKDRYSGYIVGLYIGSRGIEGAQGLWNSLPRDYQELANFTPIFGKLMPPSFRNAVMTLSARNPDRHIMSKDTTAHSDSVFLDSYGKPFPSRKSWRTIWEPSGILSIT